MLMSIDTSTCKCQTAQLFIRSLFSSMESQELGAPATSLVFSTQKFTHPTAYLYLELTPHFLFARLFKLKLSFKAWASSNPPLAHESISLPHTTSASLAIIEDYVYLCCSSLFAARSRNENRGKSVPADATSPLFVHLPMAFKG